MIVGYWQLEFRYFDCRGKTLKQKTSEGVFGHSQEVFLLRVEVFIYFIIDLKNYVSRHP